MIVAKLDALKTYSFLGENFSYIVDFINQEKLTDLSDGKFDLNDSIFYIVSSYQTKPQGLIENHQKYIDLQILLEGKELVGYKDLLNIKSVNYDNENDIEFFDSPDIYIPFLTDYFMVFFTNDGHAPGINFKERSEKVRKVVFKIPVQ